VPAAAVDAGLELGLPLSNDDPSALETTEGEPWLLPLLLAKLADALVPPLGEPEVVTLIVPSVMAGRIEPWIRGLGAAALAVLFSMCTTFVAACTERTA